MPLLYQSESEKAWALALCDEGHICIQAALESQSVISQSSRGIFSNFRSDSVASPVSKHFLQGQGALFQTENQCIETISQNNS